MTAGPAGWLVLGAAVVSLSLVQRRASLRRLDDLRAAAGERAAAEPASAR